MRRRGARFSVPRRASARRGIALFFLLLSPCALARNTGALVLVNSQSPDYPDFPDLLEPYLKVFGVPYAVRDLARDPAPPGDCALLILGHRGLDAPRRFFTPALERTLLQAVRNGAGLVSFDGLLASWRGSKATPLYDYPREIFHLAFRPGVQASEIAIEGAHWITALGPVPRTVTLKSPLLVPLLDTPAPILARAADAPLLLAAAYGAGRAVLFASYDWVRPGIKGKLYGLDDLVWRSLVWAARKPFVIRHVPKLLAMRVDDVSGFGIGSNQHLGWIETANRYGLKPWVGVFIDDLREDPEAVARLARLTRQGLATASVHARRWREFFYLDEPLATDDTQRNIAGRPWPAQKMAANWDDAEAFFKENGIVKSKVVLPHFYEFALNNFEGIRRWGGEFTGTVLQPGHGYGTSVPKSAPYLTGEPPRLSNGKDPIYIAGWLNAPGFDRLLFNFVVEIRDVAGYEWAPSGVPIDEAIRRGVEETRREFDSLLPGVLFTHESDHIRHIRPEDWDRILKGIMDQLQEERPVPVTLDDASRYLRALATSAIAGARADGRGGALDLTGSADVETKFYVYDSGGAPREFTAPAFQGRAEARWNLN